MNACADVVELSAIGDLMLCGEWEHVDVREQLGGLGAAMKADVVFANLETTIEGSQGQIAKQPRVIARTDTVADALAVTNVDIVNVANNHAFDAYDTGFGEVRRTLESLGIEWVGAGNTAAEAAAAKILDVKGMRLGFLAFVDRATMPSHVASTSTGGVNPLDEDAVVTAATALRPQVDHVIVSLHWGVEYCQLPSPDHRRLARALVDQGTSVVIGHHAHVIQGVERRGRGLIAYGLGNATTTDFSIDSRLAIRQTPRTRSSFVLRLTLGPDRVTSFECVPIRSIRGGILMNDAKAGAYLARANKLLSRDSGLAAWRLRRFVEDVPLRILRKLHPAVIRSIRREHLLKPFLNVHRALAGRGPTA